MLDKLEFVFNFIDDVAKADAIAVIFAICSPIKCEH